MKIPTRHIALIVLLIFVPVSAWAIAYRPTNSAVCGIAQEIRSRTQSLSHFDEINEQYRELKTLTRDLDESIEQLNSRIPTQHNAEVWLESASSAALGLGLIVRSVSTSGERAEGDVSVLPVDLTVAGKFESVYGLVQHLEQMERVSRVDRMTIHRADENSVEARFVIHLVFSGRGS
jgi:Tfp pilus assembly protein PilO